MAQRRASEKRDANLVQGNVDITAQHEGAALVTKRRWANEAEFIMSCLSMTVGLANFWRFPYVCYQNGGGAFLFPYVIVLIFVGRPMYFVDLAMGQFSGRGSINMYNKLGSAWTGIGITQAACCLFVLSYYAYILAVDVFYFMQSFNEDLPWDVCLPRWGNNCVTSKDEMHGNITQVVHSSADLYLNNVVLNSWGPNQDGFGLGAPNLRLCICLCFTWLLTFINCIAGIKTIGKFSYVLALFPFFIMLVMLIRACTMPGAATGIIYLLNPEWSKLQNPHVWMAAFTQCLFSLGIGYNIIANYAAYNNLHAKLNRAALILTVADTFSSLLCSFAIFAAIGNVSERLNIPVSDVMTGQGMHLAFVTYTDSISMFGNVPYIYAIVFFIMFFCLGMGSMVGFVQVLIANFMELVPKMKEWHVVALVCTFGFFSSIIYTTRSGERVLNMVDTYGNTHVISILAFLQVFAICFSHGLMNWCWDLEFMLKCITNFYWRWTWSIVSPLVMLLIYVYGLTQPITFISKAYKVVGCVILSCLTITVFVAMVWAWIVNRHLGFVQAVKKSFSSERWMPFIVEDVEQYQIYRTYKRNEFVMKDENPFLKYIYTLIHKQ